MDTGQSAQVLRKAPSYADLRRRVLIFASIFCLFVLLVTVAGFVQLRHTALEAARHRAESYSTILGAHMDRTIGAIDARLAQVAVQSERLGGPAGARTQWRAVLEATRGGARAIGSISILDTAGVIRHSTLERLVGQARREGAIFRSLRDPNAPDLVTEPPFESPYSGDMLLPFARRLTSGGRVSGAVVATFVPEPLREFYRSIGTEGAVVRILHSSGALVLEEPASGKPPLGHDPVIEAFNAGAERGVIVGPIAPGGPELITSYAPAGEGGVILAVSLDRRRALQAWRQEAIIGGLILAGVLVAFWIAVALMLGQLDARAEAEAALLRQQQRSADAQRLESLGQLTGGVAHDFNNLLTVIVGAADSLLTRVSDELRPRVDAILYAADNATMLIKQLLAFSRRQALQLAPVNVNATVMGMEDMLRRSLGPRVETQFVLASGLWRAYADRTQIESALLNLAINARDAMPEGGKLTIETHNAHLDHHYASQNPDVSVGDYVALAVTDTGVGMTPDVQERALEPFFTTKEVGKGSGLGLSMVYGFARQSKGHVKIYSEPGRGTTVRLYLPRDRDGGDAPDVIQTAASDRGSESILVVEDDAQVRQLAASSLRERGYTVIEATTGAEAVLALDGPGHIDLILTDVVMPGAMTGKEVAEHALQARPGVKVLFTSGYADASVVRNGMVKAGARFLSKPYRGSQLAAMVRALLDA
jgi:signal transduction histidine kinase/ActR/RegA family two-component response regulator